MNILHRSNSNPGMVHLSNLKWIEKQLFVGYGCSVVYLHIDNQWNCDTWLQFWNFGIGSWIVCFILLWDREFPRVRSRRLSPILKRFSPRIPLWLCSLNSHLVLAVHGVTTRHATISIFLRTNYMLWHLFCVVYSPMRTMRFCNFRPHNFKSL